MLAKERVMRDFTEEERALYLGEDWRSRMWIPALPQQARRSVP